MFKKEKFIEKNPLSLYLYTQIAATHPKKDGIRCTKIEHARFPLYYTIRNIRPFRIVPTYVNLYIENTLLNFSYTRALQNVHRITEQYTLSSLHHLNVICGREQIVQRIGNTVQRILLCDQGLRDISKNMTRRVVYPPL